jgi:hypothetical protein
MDYLIFLLEAAYQSPRCVNFKKILRTLNAETVEDAVSHAVGRSVSASPSEYDALQRCYKI